MRLWIIWFWFVALDALGLIIATFEPSFSPPRWVYWAIPALGFVAANVKLFNEQANRIIQLSANKANALQAVAHEMALNRTSADYNIRLRGSTSSPGALPFKTLEDYACQEVFLSGRFAFDDALLHATRDYLQTIKHINTLIDSVEASTTRFQNATSSAEAIRRYCSGQLNPTLDSQAMGLPDVIDRLQKLVEREIGAQHAAYRAVN